LRWNFRHLDRLGSLVLAAPQGKHMTERRIELRSNLAVILVAGIGATASSAAGLREDILLPAIKEAVRLGTRIVICWMGQKATLFIPRGGLWRFGP